MAEVVGVIASVVTVTKALITGVELVKTLYQAEAEVQLLLGRLNRFADIVAEISSRAELTQSPIITSNLASSKRTVDRLNTIIQTKVLRCSKAGQKIRRKAWLRNKSKIIALQADLELHKDSLVTAMGALNLASSSRAEMMLNSIVNDTSSLRTSSSNVDARLVDIQRLISDTRSNTMTTQATIARIMLLLDQPRTPWAQELSAPNETLLLGPPVGDPFMVYYTSGHDTNTAEQHTCNHSPQVIEVSPTTGGPTSNTTHLMHPATSFEMSKRFRPSAYTSTNSVPAIIITSYHQQTISRSSRTNIYNGLLSRSPNVYHQFTLSLEIHKSSRYWRATKVSKEIYNSRDALSFASLFPLPCNLQDHIQQLLASEEALEERSCVAMFLTEEEQHGRKVQQALSRVRFRSSQRQPSKPSLDGQAMIAYLKDLGCPLWIEQEVHLLAVFEPPTRYLSSIQGRLMVETKCMRYPLSQDFVYDVQAFHCLREMPGVLNFGGVVIDHVGKHVRSYLLELPKTKCSLLLDRISEDACAQWEDVEIWSRKLVEVVRQVHSMNYVIGTLRRERVPILVDSFDRLYVWRVEIIPSFGGTQDVFYPPEYIDYRGVHDKSDPQSQLPRITHKFDIYMLGMLLWVFAQSWAEQRTATSIRRRFHHACKPPYMDVERQTIRLPPLHLKVPHYYQDIVDACRRDDPSTRPSAVEILEILTNKQSTMPPASISPKVHSLVDVLSLRECVTSSPSCDTCGIWIHGTFYHCNTCANGDYDICATCFDSNQHCQNKDHLLVEVKDLHSPPAVKKYYSSMKSTGSREFLEL
ncbi:hypothetical protein BKA63DRAFT_237874 [Paraphoma chrysanthemicola]|nr:hypothetical protein BKA63DRAFT_237874 [Paraphoma chrysanthemicola]